MREKKEGFKPALIFGDGAVLQRRQPIKVFGTAAFGAKVTVTLQGQGVYAEASGSAEKKDGHPEGSWCVCLPAMEAAEGLTMTLRCEEETVTLQDIAVGEVWIAGGQSNMEFWLRNEAERDTVIPAAQDPLLRFFDMPRISYEGQEKEVSFAEFGKWRKFFPEEAGWFSAVGAYFGMELRRTLKVPVAVVGCNCGATSASCWLDEQYLAQMPKLEFYRENYERTVAKLDVEAYERDFRERQKFGMTPRMQEFDKRMARGEIPAEELADLLRGLTPRQLHLLSLPVGPLAPTRPFALYHNMVEKLAPYTAKGVIWYQGEADALFSEQYACLFGQMVKCWRDLWGLELPFLTVQLAPFGHWLGDTGNDFPALRRQQRIAADQIPGVWMASIMDAGMEEDIHPKKKRIPGERLALLARGKVYGEKTLLCQAPRLVSAHREGDCAILRFDYAGEGLSCGQEIPEGLSLSADGETVKPQVRIDGSCLILRSSRIEDAASVEVSYAWQPYVQADLYSSAGLTAEPFHTVL